MLQIIVFTSDGLNFGETKFMSKKRIKNYLGRNFNKKREKDKISPEQRSKLMSGIFSKNTKFEQDFINLLKKSVENKFQTNVKVLKGKPDLVFQKEKLCVFLDSDFWHGWQYPRWKHLLKNDFWREKINNNRKRDIRILKLLRRNGRKVLRVWEHKINKNPLDVVNTIKQALVSEI